MSALLEVQNLEKQFPIVGSRKVVQAVNGVDFVIESGETLALVGESGSGKTTIGRAVVGLIEATAGEIRFDGKQMGRGRDIRSRDIRGRIQLVFQEPAESLNPRIRVGETMAEPLRYLGLPRADREARVRDVAARLGLGERALDQFPAELSAGQQQRVGIGRAIVTKPQLIVLDEPTSALDPTARAEIVDLLRRCSTNWVQPTFSFPTTSAPSAFSAIGWRCCISVRLWKKPIPSNYSRGRCIPTPPVCSLPSCCLIRRSSDRARSRLRARYQARSVSRPVAHWRVDVRSRTRTAGAHGPMRFQWRRGISSVAIITTRSRPSTRQSIISPISRRNRRRFSALEQVERTRRAKRMTRRRMTDTF
jgi:ABC-type dipeptide/oligopeptide/nickel transport system ATPase subunit